jgi:hypothetical protein
MTPLLMPTNAHPATACRPASVIFMRTTSTVYRVSSRRSADSTSTLVHPSRTKPASIRSRMRRHDRLGAAAQAGSDLHVGPLPDWKTLYFANWNFLGSVNLRIAGMPVPAVKRA